MPTLTSLLTPQTTAVVTMEVQRAVCGDMASIADLAAAANDTGLIPNVAGLCSAARAVGAHVVHCTAMFRPDGAGSKLNARVLSGAVRLHSGRLDVGTPGTEVVPELGPEPGDIEVARLHGVSPFTSTALDQILRNLGVTTVVATGVSLNVGVIGLVISAVDLGYQVVIARDATIAVPSEYGSQMFANSLTLLATVCSTRDITDVWEGIARSSTA
jgi:nicotinamidase-related amidase